MNADDSPGSWQQNIQRVIHCYDWNSALPCTYHNSSEAWKRARWEVAERKGQTQILTAWVWDLKFALFAQVECTDNYDHIGSFKKSPNRNYLNIFTFQEIHFCSDTSAPEILAWPQHVFLFSVIKWLSWKSIFQDLVLRLVLEYIKKSQALIIPGLHQSF